MTRRRRLWRWLRAQPHNRPFTSALVLMTILWATSLFGVYRTIENNCNGRREDRAVLVALVKQSASGGADLSSVEGFEKLDPETQEYLLNVEEASGGGAWVDAALDLLADPPC